MRPTTAPYDNVVDFNSFLHPRTAFEHPRDVVAHPELSLSEKRAILASWASDASAIASCPSLRAPEGLKAPVTIDEILEALCALDEGPRTRPVASQYACGPSRGAPLFRRGAMEEVNLPRHVIETLEKRWARSLQRHAVTWRTIEPPARRRTAFGLPVERRSRRSQLAPVQASMS